MSRPRFLANHDLNNDIITGVLRKEPSIEFLRLIDFHLQEKADPEVLEFAAANGLILVSHDVHTMTAHAYDRLAVGEAMAGIFLIHQTLPVGRAIEDLLIIWDASEAGEWQEQITFLPL